MIYDSLKHAEIYQGVHPGVQRGLALLRDTDFSKMEDGRHEIDGDNLFILLQSYEKKQKNDILTSCSNFPAISSATFFTIRRAVSRTGPFIRCLSCKMVFKSS